MQLSLYWQTLWVTMAQGGWLSYTPLLQAIAFDADSATGLLAKANCFPS